jgi:hypothetical protein
MNRLVLINKKYLQGISLMFQGSFRSGISKAGLEVIWWEI